ncbi:hypothetical protein LRP49_01780 [Enterovibrio sp. ZSDZ35]|uniref:DUF4878 domain-containing protein n=1 Tax=Enterovibrio qingdaonensis TaxID=2899818 RepID=A0ABT5QG18_9GAMM|nr:hypothetical protein [Enterovibrio sp. ZSDZ35]MDD1779915.1 hypothetical protein [Enterovibrio sp. ZSDZ35]
MPLCNSRKKAKLTKTAVALGVSLLLVSNVWAYDCQKNVQNHASLKAKNFLVDVSVDVPQGIPSSGTFQIIGFRCLSDIEPDQPFKMSMSKSAALPQFDIIYTDEDGVRFNNIMQAPVFPWSETVNVDMNSTVLADLLKNIPNFKRYNDLDKQRLIAMSRDSAHLKEWASLRSQRTSANPLVYAYPLPDAESKLLSLAIDEFHSNNEQLQQSYVDKVTQQPEDVILAFFESLKAGKKSEADLTPYFEKKYLYEDRYMERLLKQSIEKVSGVELTEMDALKGRAFATVTYTTTSNPSGVKQKFMLKRQQSTWLISSAYQPKPQG